MPDRLPTFKPPWLAKRARPRAPDARPSASKRGYGSRAWKLARQQVLVRDNYQCRVCLRVVHGRNAHVDHVIRKADGSSDEISGLQVLCASCHGKKTRQEMQGTGVGQKWNAHPQWLGKSVIPITVVSGPPASGKTTYVEKHSKPKELVIDLDVIASTLANTSLHGWGLKWLGPSIRQRNQMLDTLSKPSAMKHGRAWLIVAEPLAQHRQWWVDTLGPLASVVVVETPAEQCELRIATDPERSSQGGKAIAWWRDYSRRSGDTVVVC